MRSCLAPNRITSRRAYQDLNHIMLEREVSIIPDIDAHRLGREDRLEHCRRSFELIERTLSSPRHLDKSHLSLIHKIFFDTLSKCFVNTTSEVVMKRVLPHFMGMCTAVRHHDVKFLEKAAGYLSDNHHDFYDANICPMLHGLAQLYFPSKALAVAVEERLLKSFSRIDEYWGSRLAWTLAWYGMVHRQYPVRLLQKILKDEYIRGMKRFVLNGILNYKMNASY